MQQTYEERSPNQSFAHLSQTVDYYLSRETPLWWVETVAKLTPAPAQFSLQRSQPIACLWLGYAIDQLTGQRHTHVFLLYVEPGHRRKGIGAALMHQAEAFARSHGDHQIGLQVFQSNQPAVNLYHQLGYETQSLWMVKPLK
jgi:ribosomal protein S18 acetylase RimI-like enzyme